MLDTEISPELIPGDGDKPTGDSESKVGPYELQDFFLFYILRFGYRPSKVAFLAEHAWGDRERGPWPDLIPAERRNEYSRAEIKHWLEVFLDRFFRTQPVQAHGDPERARRSAPAARSPRAATGARRATPTPRSGSTSCARTSRTTDQPNVKT